MIIGTDQTGTVLMVGSGTDIARMPSTLNGTAITAYLLTSAQEASYGALPADRAGTIFDGKTFTALQSQLSIANIAAAPLPAFSTANDLAAFLRGKGLI